MPIQGKIISGQDNLDDAFAVRRAVFVEEQGIPAIKVFDDLDSNAVHVVIYIDIPEAENKLAVAAGRMTYDGENCIIDNISVRKEYRGKRYGDLTVRMLLNKAFQSGINKITLKTEVQYCEFFKKIGFLYEGEGFGESKIPFCKMIIHKEEFTTLCEKYRKI